MPTQCGLAEKTHDNNPISETRKLAPDADADESAPMRVPLRIDDAIVVRTLTGPARMASCRIVGASHNKFILITEPAVKINERVSAILDESFLCSYFCDGYLYTFESSYGNRLMNDIVSIEYPREVAVRRIRKDRRIKVNIETKVVVCDSGESFAADMRDISRGGCCLATEQPVPVAEGSTVLLTFGLPNEAVISDLQAVAVRVNSLKNREGIQVGLSFQDQGSEIGKVADFCAFCMYFEME
ncbi:MAG TPA: PilZ domain-containing protein [Syntrophobacteraceae bacterium]|nr:PilZ domain-containing protein [Syntrophobacteraceae bacterium]